MPRPKAADASATRARILVAAGGAFASGGKGGASIRQIAGSAGVSLAMIGHYFGSKDGLYEACIDAMYEELAPLSAELLAQLGSGMPLTELIGRAVRTGFRFARAHQAPSRLLFRQLTVAGELDADRMETQQRPFLDATSAALAAATGREAESLRLPLQSAVVLVARYGISSLAELSTFVGRATASRDVLARVEEHLVAAVLSLLSLAQEKNS